MNLRDFETLLCVARAGSFTAAAGQLGITQPGVTRRVRELELELGQQLFERVGRQVRLTPQGRRCLEFAERVTALTRAFKAEVSDRRAMTGSARLGVAESIALTWLPDLVRIINRDYPLITLELDVDSARRLWRKLEAGTLDMVFQPGPVYLPGMRACYLGTLRLGWMAGAQQNLPGLPVTAETLPSWPVISQDQDSNVQCVLDEWLGGTRAQPRRLDICNSMSAVASLTRAGVGISLLSPDLYAAEIARGDLVPLRAEPAIPPIDYWAAYPMSAGASLLSLIAEVATATSTFPQLRRAVPVPRRQPSRAAPGRKGAA